MSQFTFNFNGVSVNQADLNKIAGSSSKFEGSLYSQTKDSDLTYAGSDPVVWDRVNSERLRRGLPSLTDIGYPKPADDTPPATTVPSTGNNGGEETFTVKGPPGMTFEQAKAIFDQQAKTGGLTGFKVGDAVNAATQAADGLATAQAQAQQGISSAFGNLPQGADLKSLSASVGPGMTGAINQAQAAFAGAGPSIATMTTGASAAINGAVSGATAAIGPGFAGLSAAAPAGFAELNSKLPGITSILQGGMSSFTGQISQAGSLVNNAIKGISGALSGTPLNGINVADFAKQGPSLGAIENLSKADVTGVMAQATKLIGQGPGDLTNSMGLGKFGFDAKQLETAGFLKPGTAAAFLQSGAGDLTSVLKSPLPWTGKDGIKGVSDLLGNGKLQDKIQQGLMSSGLGAVKQLGIPTDKLAPAALGGVATLAAKDPAAAVASLTGNLPSGLANNLGGLKDKVNDVMTNSAFAVKLTEGKVEPPLKQEEPAPAETNTVNTATVDAAGQRIVGNDKVPNVTGSSSSNSAEVAVNILFNFVNQTSASFDALAKTTTRLYNQSSITLDEYTRTNEEYQAIRATYNARKTELIDAAEQEVKALSQSDPNYAKIVNLYNGVISKLIPLLLERNKTVKEILASLANKIAT